MHFSKVISVTVFAVLATASPVPADFSVDLGQIQAVAQSFSNFAGSTDGAASDLSGQLQALGAGGASAEVRRTITIIAVALVCMSTDTG
jgi:hypothetical protein